MLLLKEWSSRKGLSASSGLEVSNPNIHGDAESSPLRSTGREACGRAERGCGGEKHDIVACEIMVDPTHSMEVL